MALLRVGRCDLLEQTFLQCDSLLHPPPPLTLAVAWREAWHSRLLLVEEWVTQACRTEQAGLLQQTRTLCSQSSHLSPGLNVRRHRSGPPEPRGDQNSTPTCREELYGGSEAR
ncbi:hypothetical protein JOQ06_009091 [Pogonophryne albipinna]|uniref:Uncharacterized protein n=1 Tax=Pogonophryne albipinna TaxID=1090488 RepID=A0AAD6BQF0_9TELE|nr:hypothetical protein JOQ06_009091 [Pogonophryne albipinna]